MITTTTYPFPTGLLRAFLQEAVHILAYDEAGMPTAACVRAESHADCAIALALLKANPDSFVLHQGLRCSTDGTVLQYDPSRPKFAGELHLTFDTEWVKLGPRPRVYVFTHSQEEWETARQAMRHLLQAGRLSPRSYLEGVNPHTGKEQGLTASQLDGTPHGPGLVAQYRETAIRMQNDIVD